MRGSRNQSNADFLVEYFQNFFARAALKELTVHLQALDSLATTFRRPELERCVLGGIVLSGFCELLDDMFNLAPASSAIS